MVNWQKLIWKFEWTYDAYASVFQLLYFCFPKKVITLMPILQLEKAVGEQLQAEIKHK